MEVGGEDDGIVEAVNVLCAPPEKEDQRLLSSGDSDPGEELLKALEDGR